MTRLHSSVLKSRPAKAESLQLPGYDRSGVRPGIIHLGVGAFHRAHQAVYTDQVLGGTGGDRWGILGASLRSPAIRERLAPQDFLYGVWSKSTDGPEALRIVGSICDVIAAGSDTGRAQLLEALADPAINIVSLTVTEAAYCHDSATGTLDESHPLIRHDLAEPHSPESVPGLLVQALSRRMRGGGAPVTLMSCDNLSGNGRVLASVVRELAARVDPALPNWIDDQVRFPGTMVDRIVPATTAADIAAAERLTGFEDRGLVVCEPYSRWVIEDAFAMGRPPWEEAGALLVADVAPHEMAKLRLLNAAHSAIAYLGRLKGHDFVHEAVADAGVHQFVKILMLGEIAPTLPLIDHLNPRSYVDEILARFANDRIAYPTLQVAGDGSRKLPERLLPVLRDRLREGWPIERSSLVLAAWIRFLAGSDEHGIMFEYQDPMAGELRSLIERHPDPADRVSAVLGMKSVFGDLSDNRLLRTSVTGWLQKVESHGVAAALLAASQ